MIKVKGGTVKYYGNMEDIGVDLTCAINAIREEYVSKFGEECADLLIDSIVSTARKPSEKLKAKREKAECDSWLMRSM